MGSVCSSENRRESETQIASQPYSKISRRSILQHEGTRASPASEGASSESAHFLNFTNSEKKGIRKVWASAVKNDIAMELIVAVITEKPKFAVFFDTTFTDEDGLRKCPTIQGHAAKIVAFITKIVDGLDQFTVEEIRKMLFGVGIIHFNKNVNFDASSYLLFKKILMEKICIGCDQNTTNAWFKLLHLFVAEMKKGFFSEVLKVGSQ